MVKLLIITEPEEPTYDSMPELIDKVNEWADNRGLKQASTSARPRCDRMSWYCV